MIDLRGIQRVLLVLSVVCSSVLTTSWVVARATSSAAPPQASMAIQEQAPAFRLLASGAAVSTGNRHIIFIPGICPTNKGANYTAFGCAAPAKAMNAAGRATAASMFGPLLLALQHAGVHYAPYYYSYPGARNYQKLSRFNAQDTYLAGDTHGSLSTDAKRLNAQIQEILTNRKSPNYNPHATFDLVGDGLGGVVAAYWVVAYATKSQLARVHSLITFDSPLQGFSGTVPAQAAVYRSGAIAKDLVHGVHAGPIALINNGHSGLLARLPRILTIASLSNAAVPAQMPGVGTAGAPWNLQTIGSCTQSASPCVLAALHSTPARICAASWAATTNAQDIWSSAFRCPLNTVHLSPSPATTGFSAGIALPVVPRGATWRPITLPRSDVHLSFPPTWHNTGQSAAGNVTTLYPTVPPANAPAPNISFYTIQSPINAVRKLGGSWTPVTVGALSGYAAQPTGLAVPTEAYTLLLPDGDRTIWVSATAGPLQNLIPQLQEMLGGLTIQGTAATGGGSTTRTLLRQASIQSLPDQAPVGPGSQVIPINQLSGMPIALTSKLDTETDAGTYDCGAASVAMILSYYQTQFEASQHTGFLPVLAHEMMTDYPTIVRYLRNFPPSPATPNPAWDPVMPGGGIPLPIVENEIPVLSNKLVVDQQVQWSADTWQANVLTQLQQGRPFIAEIANWSLLAANEKGDYAHSIVITGIDMGAQTVTYNDPETGSAYTMSFSHFNTAWASNQTLSHGAVVSFPPYLGITTSPDSANEPPTSTATNTPAATSTPIPPTDTPIPTSTPVPLPPTTSALQLTIAANPSTVTVGQPNQLCITVSEEASVVLTYTYNGGPSNSIPLENSNLNAGATCFTSQPLTVPGTVVITAVGTATGGGGSVSSQATVTVVSPAPIVPGGIWVSPANGATTTGPVQFAAEAYPTNPGDPAIAYVNFTMGWPTNNPTWTTACTANSPIGQAPDGHALYGCTVDLSTRTPGPPPGPVLISFDVYDSQYVQGQPGHYNQAPNGEHTISFAPPINHTVSVTVPATAQWVDTGLQVTAGGRLQITASGQWSPGEPNPAMVGPDGSDQQWPDNFLNLTDIGQCASCASTATAHWAALIGYIGANPPQAGSYTSTSVAGDAQHVFFVGGNLTGTTQLTGELWLNFNDDAYSDSTSDNAGQVTAQVTVSPGN